VRQVQIELRLIDARNDDADTDDSLVVKNVDEKKVELKIKKISFSGKPHDGNWVEREVRAKSNEPEEEVELDDEEESCKCCCGYNSESPSCCSNPDEVISKSKFEGIGNGNGIGIGIENGNGIGIGNGKGIENGIGNGIDNGKINGNGKMSASTQIPSKD
jgi:hypothetical protein